MNPARTEEGVPQFGGGSAKWFEYIQNQEKEDKRLKQLELVGL